MPLSESVDFDSLLISPRETPLKQDVVKEEEEKKKRQLVMIYKEKKNVHSTLPFQAGFRKSNSSPVAFHSNSYLNPRTPTGLIM